MFRGRVIVIIGVIVCLIGLFQYSIPAGLVATGLWIMSAGYTVVNKAVKGKMNADDRKR